ncbi:LIM homeobox transcription factor 1-beta-like isoform X2 [Melanaphis sacchari]|uniref:LIM homeobox transcription factor 1-beta-like isoform X2 n=1 Tax=Melanaphis sacchari TaxID=742174 RepID=UPI000DC137C4|nr:LIM homeobox transcription factor 1-beta-like isoform X2 [Melanaphis sacchari]
MRVSDQCAPGLNVENEAVRIEMKTALGVVKLKMEPIYGDDPSEPATVSTVCAKCECTIADRYIMRVSGRSYHERCLKCTTCALKLDRSCFVWNSKLYCRQDYDKCVYRSCGSCGDHIAAGELVMRAGECVFHEQCFVCVVCGIRLCTGDQYVIKHSQLFCRPDYEKEVNMMRDEINRNTGEWSYNHDGRRGPKRPRTILTTQQRRAFKASFELSPKPCRKVREGLAHDTGLSVRIVQVWFQNQRAKMKKIQKKAKLNSNSLVASSNNINGNNCSGAESGNSCSSSGLLQSAIKDEQYSSDGCEDGVPGRFETTQQQESHRQSQQQMHEPFHIRHQSPAVVKQDSMPSFLQQQPFGIFGQDLKNRQEPNYLTSDIMIPKHIYGGFVSQETVIRCGSNPIDRLYSMQASYFCNNISDDASSLQLDEHQ